MQALYSIQGLCNPLMGVFDVNHALLFYASQMASKTLSRENHGKNWAKKKPTALFSSDWHFKLLGYPDSRVITPNFSVFCFSLVLSAFHANGVCKGTKKKQNRKKKIKIFAEQKRNNCGTPFFYYFCIEFHYYGKNKIHNTEYGCARAADHLCHGTLRKE